MNTRTVRPSPLRVAAPVAACLALAALAGDPVAADLGRSRSAAGGWPEVDQLVAAQRFQAALQRVEGLGEAARAAGDEPGGRGRWSRRRATLVLARLRDGGAPAARRAVARGAPRPRRSSTSTTPGRSPSTCARLLGDPRARAGGRLRRGRTGPPPPGSPAEIDLEAWTADEIYAEAQRAFLAAWQERESWGRRARWRRSPPTSRPTTTRRASAAPCATRSATCGPICWPTARCGAGRERRGLPARPRRPDRGSGEGVDLADPAVHPLRKLAAVLGDLEAWHRAGGRPEAAFEARRARLDQLHGAFDRADDRRAPCVTDLRTQLDVLGRDADWWSMGMATLAEWTQGEDGARRRRCAARELAAAAKPPTRRASAAGSAPTWSGSIEAPSYGLMAMASDGPGRRSLAVDHQNLDRLYFPRFPLRPRRPAGVGARRQRAAALGGCAEHPRRPPRRASGRSTLPPTPDFRRHRTYVIPPLARPGLYIVVASARADFAEDHNRRSAVNLIVGDLVLISRGRRRRLRGDRPLRAAPAGRWRGCRSSSGPTSWHGGQRRVAVQHHRRRRPGAVRRRLAAGRGALRARRTGRRGRHRRPVPPPPRAPASRASARRRWSTPTAPSTGRRRPSTGRRSSTTRTRRGALRHPARHRPHRRAGRSRRRGGGLDRRPRPTPSARPRAASRSPPAACSASGRCAPPLGGQTAVRVEEYKRPTFEVTLRDPAEPLRLNRPATLTGEARYYFGLPVAAGGSLVGGRASRSIPSGGGGSGSGGRAPGRRHRHRRRRHRPPRRRRHLRGDLHPRGRRARGGDRRALLPLPAPRRRHRRGGRDPLGQPLVPARLRRRRDHGRRRVRPSSSPASRPASPSAAPTSTACRGRGRASGGSSPSPPRRRPCCRPISRPSPRRAESREPRRPATGPRATASAPGGTPNSNPSRSSPVAGRPRGRPRRRRTRRRRRRRAASWPDLAPSHPPNHQYPPRRPLARAGTPATPRQPPPRPDGPTAPGRYARRRRRRRAGAAALPPGAYRLRYTTTDAYGATFRVAREFVVAAAGAPAPPLPLYLAAERPTVEVGGTVRLLVASGLADQPLPLERYRGSRRIERRELSSAGGARILEWPVGPEDRGGFTVVLTALADHQADAPDVRGLRPVERPRAEGRVRHLPRPHPAGDSGALAGDGEGAGRRRGRAGGGGSGGRRGARLHVRQEPRPLRGAPAGQPAGALPRPPADAVDLDQPRLGPRGVDLGPPLRGGAAAPSPPRRRPQALRRRARTAGPVACSTRRSRRPRRRSRRWQPRRETCRRWRRWSRSPPPPRG